MKKIILLLTAMRLICCYSQTSTDFLLRARAKSDAHDENGAILDYDLAIKDNPKYAEAYYYRGISKCKLKKVMSQMKVVKYFSFFFVM